jgi:hypothetical protein
MNQCHQIHAICARRIIPDSQRLRIRVVDMFLREHITLLWVIEGGTYLRVHPPGVVYFYDEAWGLTA